MRVAVSCRELLENGRHGEVRGAAVSCHKVPEQMQKWGKARRKGRGDIRGCKELPCVDRNLQINRCGRGCR